MAYTKPLPHPTKEDEPFWQAAKEHRLILPKCRACGHVWFPPYASCGKCLSLDRDWVEVSGRGKVWGYVHMQQPYLKSFVDDIPYNVVLVQLDEGPLMFSNVVDAEAEAIRVDMPVEVVFGDVTEEFTLLKFRPAGQ